MFFILGEDRHDRGEGVTILTDNQLLSTGSENVIELLELRRQPLT